MGCVVCRVEFWLGYLQERDHMEDQDILELNIEMDCEDRGWGSAWSGLIWLRTVTSCTLLLM